MGKVLEMRSQSFPRVTFLRLVVSLTFCVAIAGCGAPLMQVALARASGPASVAVAKPVKDSPQITMTLVSRGIKFPLQQLDTQDDVRLWASGDGAQVALRDGMLISTRGFGMDLMSADVPSVAGLMGDHGRIMHYLDGTDTPIRRSYQCSTSVVAADDKMPNTTHLREVCISDAGKITNDYWISAGNRLVKSRQWISQGVGYAIFNTVDR